LARYGLLIDHDFCTGCHSCEVACQQEHGYPVGTNGIVVKEYEYEIGGRVKIDFMPFLTDHCDLCTARMTKNERPACVKHCQAAIMEFGLTQDLAATMKDRPRAVLYTHAPVRKP
jgi:Fe-S-cluster-containing dehydrogenase component